MENYQVQMITAFLAFLGGWGLSLLNDRRHKLQQVKDGYNSLLHELREELKDLDSRKEKMFTIDEDHMAKTNTIMIRTARYESLIYSGIFRQLDYDVQNRAVEVYGQIKHVNHMSDRLLEVLTDRTMADSIFISNMNKFGENIDEQINEIKNKIPKLINLIEEKMPTALL